MMEQITGIPELQYDPEYIGGGTHENLSGQELDFHVDFNYHPKSKLHRRLNMILFLNPIWKPEWGGELELISNPYEPNCNLTEKVKFAPSFNNCVIFETHETSWHGFPPISIDRNGLSLSRKSIAVYFYVKPGNEKVKPPPHSTIYVNRQLPLHLKQGHCLTHKDQLEIETLIKRRDGHLKTLYQREQRYEALLFDLHSQRILMETEENSGFKLRVANLNRELDSWKTDRLGHLVHPHRFTRVQNVSGFFQDNWVANDFSLNVCLIGGYQKMEIHVHYSGKKTLLLKTRINGKIVDGKRRSSGPNKWVFSYAIFSTRVESQLSVNIKAPLFYKNRECKDLRPLSWQLDRIEFT